MSSSSSSSSQRQPPLPPPIPMNDPTPNQGRVGVEYYGCRLNDSSVDNGPSLKKALYDVMAKGWSLVQPAGTLYLKTPIYLKASEVANRSRWRWIGEGAYGGSRVAWRGGSGLPYGIKFFDAIADECELFVIEGIGFDGGMTIDGPILDMDAPHFFSFSRNSIDGVSSDGIGLKVSKYGVKLTENYFRNSSNKSNGVALELGYQLNGAVIRDNLFELFETFIRGTHANGYATKLTIQGNTFDTCSGPAILLLGGATGLDIDTNYFENPFGGRAVKIPRYNAAALGGTDTVKAGIVLSMSNGTMTHDLQGVSIAHNWFTFPTTPPDSFIAVSGCNGVIVEGNSAYRSSVQLPALVNAFGLPSLAKANGLIVRANFSAYQKCTKGVMVTGNASYASGIVSDL